MQSHPTSSVHGLRRGCAETSKVKLAETTRDPRLAQDTSICRMRASAASHTQGMDVIHLPARNEAVRTCPCLCRRDCRSLNLNTGTIRRPVTSLLKQSLKHPTVQTTLLPRACDPHVPSLSQLVLQILGQLLFVASILGSPAMAAAIEMQLQSLHLGCQFFSCLLAIARGLRSDLSSIRMLLHRMMNNHCYAQGILLFLAFLESPAKGLPHRRVINRVRLANQRPKACAAGLFHASLLQRT